ncbi:DUF6266 family protein [Pedobacter hartonius]|uniref:Uncharacterized protein n=1 Tax=Pedobacter hartonius TaxID=425514 RepID=A0A1H4CMU4_9SPHI|nr:DUF6266 family protein [Pedobacter hartonius]SEA61362.1 hypothetical protein SAMN05443550_104100 [Pedobacter hartonius]
MATIRKGILGGFSGTAGPATGTNWRGQDVLKGRSKKRIEKEDLLPQNFKLKVMSEFLGHFSALIKIGFYHRNKKDTPFNRAMSYNLERAITGEAPDYDINYKKIVFSKGNREPAWSVRAMLEQKDQININWEVPETANIKVIANDLAKIVIYNETKKEARFSATAIRSDLSITVTIPEVFIGNKFHLWMFFVSPDGKNVSNSDYLGRV